MSAHPVCQKCFENDQSEAVLSSVQGCRLHPASPKVDVYWHDADNRFYKIRPMPDKEISGGFIMCHFGPQCKGVKCTYAHSRAEQDAWNRQKFGKLCYIVGSAETSNAVMSCERYYYERVRV